MFLKKIQLVHEADKGTETANPVTPPATGGNEQAQPEVEAKFTQDDINRIIDERLERERRKQREEKELAEKTIEEQLLAAQGKFEELNKRREKEIGELSSTLDAHKSALGKYLELQRKSVPEAVITLLDKLSAVDQLDWIATNADKLKSVAAVAGVPETPKPANPGSAVNQEQQEEVRRRARLQLSSVF